MSGYFEYDPDKAYAFGLRIRQYVRDRDLSGLFSLVDGELQRGPRRSYVEGKSFDEVFRQDWRTAILRASPKCTPVGWRGFMLASGRLWYRHMGEDRYAIVSVSDWVREQLPPVPTIWRTGTRLLSPGCFVYEWLSSDNFEAFEDAYDIRGTSGDFSRRPGAWLGNPIDVERGAWLGDEKVELWRAVRRCARPPSHISGFEEDGTVLWFTPEDVQRDDSYRLLARIPITQCQSFAPSLRRRCTSSYLVRLSVDCQGSMGCSLSHNIYGVFEDGEGGETVFLLRTFRSESEARNFVADLLKGG